MNTLTLSISNLDQLQHGVTARHQFDRNGGTVGSENTDWLMVDRDRRVQPLHCEIRWLEAGFCIIDRCEQTFLNESLRSLGQRSPVRLQEGDQLRIGAFRLQVHYTQDHASDPSLEELFTPGRRVLDALLADEFANARQTEVTSIQTPVDICSAFNPGIGHDPLAALDATLRTVIGEQNALQQLFKGEKS